jgi:hypothetical protein
MSDIRATVTVETHGREIFASILGNAIRGQNRAGEALLADAVALTPEQTGDLKGAGQVINAEQPGEDTLVVFDRPQAARLHEHPEYNFSHDANPKAQGKYLETPAIQNRDTYLAIIAKEAGL